MIGIVHRPPCTWTKEHSQSPTACSSWTTPRCSRTTTTTLRLHGGRAARRAAPAELFHPTSRSPLVCDATCDVDPEKQDPQVRNLKLECIICPVAVYPPVHVHAHVRGRAASRTPNAPGVRTIDLRACDVTTQNDTATVRRRRPRQLEADLELVLSYGHPVAVQYHCIALQSVHPVPLFSTPIVKTLRS